MKLSNARTRKTGMSKFYKQRTESKGSTIKPENLKRHLSNSSLKDLDNYENIPVPSKRIPSGFRIKSSSKVRRSIRQMRSRALSVPTVIKYKNFIPYD